MSLPPSGWLEQEHLAALATENSDAHRVWSRGNEWIERFGDDYLVSNTDGNDKIVPDLHDWAKNHCLPLRRVFVRRLIKQPGASDIPACVHGPADAPLVTTVRERELLFQIDFGAGYSVGLFTDQRQNRAFLESLRPRSLLNCFAYTCAFSVAAARTSAATFSIDLSRKALSRGRVNFDLNQISTDGHRFVADDVFATLPRLARRGEQFDVIVLDPPTFSRNEKGRIFRAEDDFPSLIDLALPLLSDGGMLLLSTNASSLTANDLASFAPILAPTPGAPISTTARPGQSASIWMMSR